MILYTMLFIFSKEGTVKIHAAQEVLAIEKKLRDGWTHTATIDPAKWIEEMANGRRNPSDMLDEIQFTK